MQCARYWAIDWSLKPERKTMKDEKTAKKGFFGMLRESFSKSGGCCCGPGETCGGPSKESDQAQTKEAPGNKEASKPAQK